MLKLDITQDSCQTFFEEVGCARMVVGDGVSAQVLFCAGGDMTLSAELGRDASLKIQLIDTDNKSSKRTIEVKYLNQGAECEVQGIVVASGDVTKEIESNVRHSVPNCVSRQNFRAIAAGTAVSRFRGLIDVAKGSDGTNALQQSDNVLLSDTAKAYTDPQMLIYADDVKCNHGATVGKRDEGALFYMKQRGIPEKDAQGLLLESFCYGELNLTAYDEETQQKVKAQIADSIQSI